MDELSDMPHIHKKCVHYVHYMEVFFIKAGCRQAGGLHSDAEKVLA